MATRKWTQTVWDDPCDPGYEERRKARLNRRERLKEREAEKEEYRYAKTALAMGATTLNEKALFDHGAKAMFAAAHATKDNRPENDDCIGAGLAAIAKVVGSLPAPMGVFEEELTKLWNEAHDRLSTRVKRKRFPNSTPLISRLEREVARRLNRDIWRQHFRFHKRGPGAWMNVYAKFQNRNAPEIDGTHPQDLRVGTDWMNEKNTRRFGDGTLVLKTDHENPGHLWLLRHGKGTSKQVVYVKETTKLDGTKASYKLVKEGK